MTRITLLRCLGLASVLGLAGCAGLAREYGGVEVLEGRAHRAGNAAQIIERSAAAVAVIETDIGRGMGFVIDEDGYLITNRHVIEDADHVEHVVFPAIDPHRTYRSVHVVYTDPDQDLALLRVQTDAPLIALPLASRKVVPVGRYLHASDPVVLLERKTGTDKRGLLPRRGRVSTLAARNPAAGPGAFVGVTTSVREGQSGGPVLDRYGRVVGVVTWTWRDRDGGYAIPIAEATRMLAERPELESDDQRRTRAEDRSRAFLEALGRGDVSAARRFTSPSHARTVREASVSGILKGLDDGGVAAMRGFVAAVDELADANRDPDAALLELERIVARTGDDEFIDALEVSPAVSSEQVVSFFFEFGQAYVAARRFGGQKPDQAVETALQRLQTVDAARTFAIAEALTELAGNEIEIERVELVPAAYTPRAVVQLRLHAGRIVGNMQQHAVRTSPEGRRLTLHMRLEWGDWYVANVVPTPLSDTHPS